MGASALFFYFWMMEAKEILEKEKSDVEKRISDLEPIIQSQTNSSMRRDIDYYLKIQYWNFKAYLLKIKEKLNM